MPQIQRKRPGVPNWHPLKPNKLETILPQINIAHQKRLMQNKSVVGFYGAMGGRGGGYCLKTFNNVPNEWGKIE